MYNFKEYIIHEDLARAHSIGRKLSWDFIMLEFLLLERWTDEHIQIRAEVEENLNRPDILKKLAKNKDPIIRLIVAESLKITPDMPEELVKELDELAEILTNDPFWLVKFGVAGNNNIKSDIFGKLAEKLKNDKDWRVIGELIANPNTPTRIRDELVEKYEEIINVFAWVIYSHEALPGVLVFYVDDSLDIAIKWELLKGTIEGLLRH